jgi:hypothetical protein
VRPFLFGGGWVRAHFGFDQEPALAGDAGRASASRRGPLGPQALRECGPERSESERAMSCAEQSHPLQRRPCPKLGHGRTLVKFVPRYPKKF